MGNRRIFSGLRTPLFAASFCVASAAFPASAGANHASRVELTTGIASSHSGYSVAGPDGAEWSVPGGARIRATAGAEVRIFNSPQSLSLTSGAIRPAYTVMVKSGKVDVSIEQGATSAVIVALPKRLSAIVEQGHATAIAARGIAAVGNSDGIVRSAEGSGAYRPLATGMVHEATNGKDEVRTLVAPPTKIAGKTVVVSPAGNAEVSGLSWDAVTGAREYRAELVATGGQIVGSKQTAGTSLDGFDGIEPGQYSFRVYSIDSNGMQSATPRQTEIRVLGVELPPGAYVDTTGAIRLAKNQQARFVGVKDLEMTYGAGGRYFRAHERVDLYRNEETIVHIGFQNSTAFATTRLAPRTVEAKVELGPQLATWPKDPIQIRIRLDDPTGQAVPDWMRATPRVLVGVREVPVTFTQKGEWLEGTLAPRKGSGPWVVRVEVADQFGVPIGRDHLEVIADARSKSAPQNIVRFVAPTKQTKTERLSMR